MTFRGVVWNDKNDEMQLGGDEDHWTNIMPLRSVCEAAAKQAHNASVHGVDG